jgi:hypothetical protein
VLQGGAPEGGERRGGAGLLHALLVLWQKANIGDRGERRCGGSVVVFPVTCRWARSGRVRIGRDARARPAYPKSLPDLS